MQFIRSSFCSAEGCVECGAAGGVTFKTSTFTFPDGNCVAAGCTEGAQFAASRFSAGSQQCVEAAHTEGAAFAGASIDGDCAEAAAAGGEIIVRDSKNPSGPHLHFSPEAWDEGRGLLFVPVGVASVPASIRDLKAEDHLTEPWFATTDGDGTDRLYFYAGEVEAFRKGIDMGEFALVVPA